jgi:hypothetical protein
MRTIFVSAFAVCQDPNVILFWPTITFDKTNLSFRHTHELAGWVGSTSGHCERGEAILVFQTIEIASLRL